MIWQGSSFDFSGCEAGSSSMDNLLGVSYCSSSSSVGTSWWRFAWLFDASSNLTAK